MEKPSEEKLERINFIVAFVLRFFASLVVLFISLFAIGLLIGGGGPGFGFGGIVLFFYSIPLAAIIQGVIGYYSFVSKQKIFLLIESIIPLLPHLFFSSMFLLIFFEGRGNVFLLIQFFVVISSAIVPPLLRYEKIKKEVKKGSKK